MFFYKGNKILKFGEILQLFATGNPLGFENAVYQSKDRKILIDRNIISASRLATDKITGIITWSTGMHITVM